jgi:hypothetical protein
MVHFSFQFYPSFFFKLNAIFVLGDLGHTVVGLLSQAQSGA